MKRTVLKTRRQVVSAVVGAYPGGRECAAARLGYELKKFDNHLYENAGSRPLRDDQIRQLEEDAGTAFFPEFVASLYGGIFVPLAQPDSLDKVELYCRAVNTAAKRGAVDMTIAEALEDGVIEVEQAESILVAHGRYLSARHEEVLATIQLHLRGKPR